MKHYIGWIGKEPWVRQVLVASGPLILTILMGMSEAYSAILLPQLQEQNSSIEVNAELSAWMASMSALPMAGGSILGAYCMEAIGRKAIHLWACLPLIFGWFIIAIARNSTFILIGRFLTGLSDGILSPPPNIYIAETSHPKTRGPLMISSSATVVIGIFIVHMMGTFTSWRSTAWICGFLPIPIVIFMYFLPESPTYLAKKKRYEEAKEAFLWCRGDSKESMTELEELLTRQKILNEAPRIGLFEHVKSFKQPELWKPTVISSVLFFTAQLSGNSVMASYTIEIFRECGLSGVAFNEYLAMNVLDLCRIIAGLSSCVLVRNCRRRTLVLIGGYGVFTSILVLCVHALFFRSFFSVSIPLICLIAYVCFIAMGLQPLSWTMMGEMFPLAHRGLGSAITSMVCYIFFFGSVQTFPSLLLGLGNIYRVFMFYGICTCLGTVVLHFYLLETKDKTLHEIEDHFKSKKNHKVIIE